VCILQDEKLSMFGVLAHDVTEDNLYGTCIMADDYKEWPAYVPNARKDEARMLQKAMSKIEAEEASGMRITGRTGAG
jgi:hypothetical protein